MGKKQHGVSPKLIRPHPPILLAARPSPARGWEVPSLEKQRAAVQLLRMPFSGSLGLATSVQQTGLAWHWSEPV